MQTQQHLAPSLWQWCLYAYGAAVTLALSYFVYMTTMNVNDNLSNILYFDEHGFAAVLHEHVVEPILHGIPWLQWRPGYFIITDLLQLAASGREHLFYKGLQILLLACGCLLFLNLLRVRAPIGLGAGCVSLLVIFGHHSFDGAVEAVYPLNPFILLFLFQLIVIRILYKDEQTAIDAVVAVTISIVSILVTEFGGIVGVTYIVGAIVRFPGASRRVAATIFCIYLLVLFIRFGFVTGVGNFGSLKSGALEILTRLVSPPLSFLISDPRGGRFATFPQLFAGELWASIYAASSIFLTGLIFVWALRTTIGSRASGESRRIIALLSATLLLTPAFRLESNKEYLSLLSLPLYAIAGYYAMCWLAESAWESATKWRLIRVVSVVAILLLVSTTWSVRAAGLFYHLRSAAYSYQEEWAFEMARLGRMKRFESADARVTADRLRRQALAVPLNHPSMVFPRLLDHLLRGRACPAIC